MTGKSIKKFSLIRKKNLEQIGKMSLSCITKKLKIFKHLSLQSNARNDGSITFAHF